MPFCTECGSQEPEGAAFCGACGQPMLTPSIVMPTRQPRDIPAQVFPQPGQPDPPDLTRLQEPVSEAEEKRPGIQEQEEDGSRNRDRQEQQDPRWRAGRSTTRHGGRGLLVRGALILVIVAGVVIGSIRVVPSVFHSSSRATPKATVTATSRSRVSYFPLPSYDTLDDGMASGPDGNLWFLGSNDRDRYSWVGRITPAGVITTFPMPPDNSVPAGTTSGSSLAGIMSGPGGNLWFSEVEVITNTGNDNGQSSSTNTYKIGRITPAGVISEFPIPVPTGLSYDTWEHGMETWDGMASGSDGNLWFDLTMASTETVTSSSGWAASTICEIGRVSSSGAITEFPVPNTLPAGLVPACELTGITPGRDGNLWFGLTINEINKANGYNISTICEIGRITPAGVITEFPVPNNYEVSTNLTYDTLDNITSGPDGDLWFDLVRRTTSSSFDDGGTIGRITPAGGITEFPMLGYLDGVDPSTGTNMVLGPDGNLWFADAFFGPDPANGQISPTYKMGRITPTGGITEFPMPNNDDEVHEIRLGPDGNLWCIVTHDGKYQVGHITLAGVITEFPVSTTSNLIRGFTFGRDGNLWFAEDVGGNAGSRVIGRFLLA